MTCRRTFEGLRRAFTLIELIVVISVIGLLAAFLLGAVSKARESSRRITCTNQLRQLGLALQSHVSVHSVYPPPMPYRFWDHRGRHYAGPAVVSGYYELLPHIEQTNLYNSINIGRPDSGVINAFAASDPVNRTAFLTRVNLFICPSDPLPHRMPQGGNSYRFNVGSSNPTLHMLLRDTPRVGAFDTCEAVPPAAYLDGLSVTVGMSERLVGNVRANRFDRKRDYWGAGVYPMVDFDTDDETLAVCRSLVGNPPEYISRLGHSWLFGGNEDVWYNHVAPPNSPLK